MAEDTKAAAPLEFFKYNPETDAEKTFNIDKALNENWDKVKAKFDSQDVILVPVTTTNNGLMLKEDKSKLDGISKGANNYVHPSTHAAGMITGLSTVATSGSYTDLLNKPSTFPPTSHTHDERYYTETEMDAKLKTKSDTTHTHDDRYYTESEINSKLSTKSDTTHNHDDRYYTESEINSKLSGKSNTGHTHDYLPLSGGDVNGVVNVKVNTTQPLNLIKGNYKAMVGCSTTDGEFLFGGSTATSSAWTDYIRVGSNKLQYKTNDVEYDIYHAGNKPTPADIGAAASVHTHDDRYYTESEINSKLSGKSNTGHTHDYLPLSGGTLDNALYIKNSDVKIQAPSVTGSWARGLTLRNNANSASLAGIGYFGNGVDGYSYSYMGVGASPWDSESGLTVSSSAIKYKNNKIYHAGDKPTPAEIGTNRVYKSLTEINSAYGVTTPLKDVITAMDTNSMAVYEVGSTKGVYPGTYGVVTIFKYNATRNFALFRSINPNDKLYTTTYHVSSNPECIWNSVSDGGDADTLDGKHASDFLPITGGTITGNFGVSGTADFIGNVGCNGELYLKVGGAPNSVGAMLYDITTKKTFSCTATTGYEILSQYCYIQNNQFVATLRIRKTSGYFPSKVLVSTFPVSLSIAGVGAAMGWSSTYPWGEPVNAYCDGDGLTVCTKSTNVTEVYVTITGAGGFKS